ncbi:MAG: diguanylate cyclase, partial [Spirochaetes bacterium]|nr:diguanylate cyclase [Spirochaetota bacterium]
KAKIYHTIGAANFKMGHWDNCEQTMIRGLKLLGEKLPLKKQEVVVSLFKELIIHIFHMITPVDYMKKKVKKALTTDKEIIDASNVLSWMYVLNDIMKFLNIVLHDFNLAKTRLGKCKELGHITSAYASLLMAIPLFKRSLKFHKKAIEILRDLNEEQKLAQAVQLFGYYHQFKAEYNKSIEIQQEALEKFRRLGDIWNLGMTLQGIGISCIYKGDYKKALDNLLEYLKISEDIKDDFGITSCLGYMIEAYIEQGELDLAEKCIKRGYIIATKQKQDFPLLGMYTGMAQLYFEKMDWKNALEYCNKAIEINEKHEFLKNYTVHLYSIRAEIHVEQYREKYGKKGINRCDLKKLKQLCNDAVKKSRAWTTQYVPALRVKAQYYALTDQRRKAKKYFEKCIELSSKIGRQFELAKAYYQYGNLLEKSKRIEGASYYWHKAYKLFQVIGAKEYVKRCGSRIGLDLKDETLKVSSKERLQSEREMTTVLETSRYFSSILDLEELLEKITVKAIELVGAERGMLLLYPDDEEAEKVLDIKVAKNLKEDEVELETFHTSKSIISRVEKEKKPLIIEDASLDEEWKKESSIIRYGIKSALCLPMMGREEMLGVIYLDNRLVSGLFTKDDLRVLEVISRQSGISIENAILYKKAITDGLTGLYTHNFFENFLNKSVHSAGRYSNPLSLLMLDIDHFKIFNDNYGHRAGDLVLKTISKIIMKTIRKSDLAARYGGEEFVIVVPETSLDGAKSLAEKLRETIAKNKLTYKMGSKNIELKVTASIGVAEF